MNYFEIFGISPVRLSLAVPALEKKFHELSWSHHPDRNPACSLEISAEINKAYRVLRDSWERVRYFLSLSEKSCPSAEDFRKVPPIMAELYFEIQEAGDKSALEQFLSELSVMQHDHEKRLSKLFEKHDQGEDVLKPLKELVHEHAYALSMQRDLKSKLESL